MTVSKSTLSFATLFFIGVLGGGIYLTTQLGGIAQSIIEDKATEALGVPVTIQSLTINLQDKKAVLKGLDIKNPEGFTKPSAMTVELISVSLESFENDLLIMDQILVQRPEVFLEVNETGSNVLILQNNAKRTSRGARLPEVEDRKPTSSSTTNHRVIINTVSVDPISVQATTSIGKSKDLEPITIPKIILNDIGKAQNGVVARQAIGQVLSAILNRVKKAGMRQNIFEGLSNFSGDSIKSLGKDGIDKLKSLF